MDRAHRFGRWGWGFDSLQARQGPLAQLAEHLPLKEVVTGSTPVRLTLRQAQCKLFMSVSTIEQGVSSEALHRHHRKYGGLVRDALGILSRNNPDWTRVELILENEEKAQQLAQAMEEALSALFPKTAADLRRKYGLGNIGDEPLSFNEMVPYIGRSSSTTSRMFERALKSLRFGDRMDTVRRIVYPERYPVQVDN